MARSNVTHLHGDGDNNEGDGGNGSNTTHQSITKNAFDKLHKAVKTAEAGMASERAAIGGLISDAVSNKHLHKGAYGIFRRLDRMDAYKRAELRFHLDIYIERAKWDNSDLFPDRKNEEAAE